MKLQDLFEMPPEDVVDVEHEITRLLGRAGIFVKFTPHFEQRASDTQRAIQKDELLRVFHKLKERLDDLQGKNIEGVIRDTFTELNIPFGLDFNARLGKQVLTLVSVMKKKNFHTKPDDLVIEV